MSDAPQGQANSQQKVLQQILLQYAAQQQQQQSPRSAAQNIVLSVPVGAPRTLPRLSLSPSTAVSPGVAIVSGSTSPLALQAHALASRLGQQQTQQYVQVSSSPLRGSGTRNVTGASPQIVHGVPTGTSPPNVYMVPGGQHALQLPVGSTFAHPKSRSPLAVTVAPVITSPQAAVHSSPGQSPRKHQTGRTEHGSSVSSSSKSPVAKGHSSTKMTSKATRTIPSHSSISTKVVKRTPETMSQPKQSQQTADIVSHISDISQLTQEQIVEMRMEILKQRRSILRELNVAYIERLTESFFLQRGGNMMDYLAWKKKIPNNTLNNYLTKHKLEEKTSRYNLPDSAKTSTSSATTPTRRKSEVEARLGNGSAEASRKRTHHKAGLDAFDFNDDVEGSPPPVKVPGGFPIPTKELSQGQPNQLRTPMGARPKDPKSPTQGTGASPVRRFLTPGTTPKQSKSPLSPGARDRLPTRQQSLSAVYDYSIGSQEKIVERAKQEAQVMQRIAELRKEGLWSAKRLPKVQEPPRYKTHWDYLLDEMQWLATDFSQERRWKKAAAKKLARAVAAYHRDKQAKEIKAERDEANKLRKIASNIAKEVKQFWGNIEKVVQYKQQSRLDEKRKKALDMQLDFIVGQTEKYSSWLTEGLNLSEKGSIQGSTPASTQGSLPASPEASDVEQNDEEFRPVGEVSDDDEETIDVEERTAEGDEDDADELELLQRESEQPIEDILSKLPPPPEGAPEQKEADLKSVLSEPAEPKEEGASTEDEEFVADGPGDEVVDDEDTIAKEEELAGEADHKDELNDLQAEGEIPIEELLQKYAGAYEEGFEVPQSSEESEMDSDDDSEYGSMEDDDEEEAADDDDDDEGELKDVGMEYLLHPEKAEDKGESTKKNDDGEAGPNQEITDIAKAAESLQPKGYTLSDTQVTTKVPSLLKHTLREYQHIGLDWLVTMNDKKLNGILADEMGLGKTIQTIALLAHLACEKGNWGPHLIVVPTSVMLNWEMEFKKWCPGFKILTYFGTQKERKQRRTGWTKQNAFHVCITSYKLVIQDHVSFRRKKWKYLVLDEAQNIKNFKSQRWQTLLNFNSQRRLLLTGTPLQNNLMELWSLMHFLMPHVFQSHREFREWFSNPMSGMIEGSQEYNEGLIKRLHKVLRPFLLRRLKSQVEKQLPQKYEHVVRCRLSKRQRFLYDDFMGRTKTKETLKTGQFLSVINVLMQLRKVCNHPDLFELRPSISSFVMEGLDYHTASEVTKALEYHPLKHVNLANFNLCLADLELTLPAYIAHRTRQLQTPRRLIEEIDSIPDPPPRPPRMKMKPGKLLTPPGVAHVQRDKLPLGRSSPSQQQTTPSRASPLASPLRGVSPVRSVLRASSPLMQGRASPGTTQVILRSPAGTPVPRQTTILPHGFLAGGAAQHTIIPTLGGGTFALVSNPNNPGTFTIVQQPAGVPSATPLQQLPGYMATSMGPLAQQRLLQQQQQQLLNRGLQMRQQQLISGHQTAPSYQIHQNQVTGNLRGATSPVSQLGQISRGGVIQLIRPTVPLVNSTPLSPPHSVIVPAPQSPRIHSLVQQQPLVQVIQQPHQPTIQAAPQLNQTPTQVVSGIPVAVQPTPIRSPQNVVQSATVGPRLSSSSPQVVNRTPPVSLQRTATPPGQVQTLTSVAQQRAQITSQQRAPTVAQQLMQRNLQATQGVRPVGTVAPIQMSSAAAKPHSTVPPSTTTVVSSTPAMQQKTSGVAAALAGKSSPVKSSLPVATPSKGGKTDASKKLTASELYQKEAAEAEQKLREEKKKSVFYMDSLEQKLRRDHKDTLRRVARFNFRRCCAKPIYGEDLYSVVSITGVSRPATVGNSFSVGAGMVHCHCCLNGTGSVRLDAAFDYTTYLRGLLNTPTGYLEGLEEIIKRFAFVVPKVASPGVSLSTSHPSPAAVSDHERFKSSLSDQLYQRLDFLHPVESRVKIQFPELRLIQYDCGKLQALDMLLRRLKVGGHRVLIFTQMAKMLDVLERFLNFHGHLYLRLDGATKIENRQILMERFNADKRIFCFILSTRSGGVGVNLTGADTVIFYDSDWNPTMDAQAQDRCHRIGQTRDVHIYRLISEMTIEENIIKKANQKRLLADVSIDGGNFTTAFFRKAAITDLFEVNEDELPASREVIKALPPPPAAAVTEEKSASPAGISQTDLEQALAKAEDESDVRAATMAHAERDAELAEFDESIPYEGEDPAAKRDGEEGSKVEMELAQLDSQLTPIEKYAVKYMEMTLEPINTEQLKEAEEMIEEAKKEWELGCLQVMTKEAEMKAEIEEDDIFFTYDREDAMNKVHSKRAGKRTGGRPPRPARRTNSRGNKGNSGGGGSDVPLPDGGTRRKTRSGASSPLEGPLSPAGPNRRSPRIRSPNHVMVPEEDAENSSSMQNHVGNLMGDGSPLVDGAAVDILSVGVARSTRSRSRSSSSTNSSSQGLGSPPGPLSPGNATKPWIITTRAQKKQQGDDGGPLSPGSAASGIRTRCKTAVRPNDLGHPS